MESRLSIIVVAKEIEARKDEILSLFEKKLKEQLELPSGVKLQDFEELIPKQIDYLVGALIRNSNSGFSHVAISKTHSLPLEVLISQFIILREVIMEVLERRGPINMEASNIIWKNIVNSIKTIVINFELQKDSESKVMKEQVIDSRQNEARFKTLVEGVEDYAVFTTNTEGLITSWNPGAQRIGQFTSQEAVGQNFSILYPEISIKKDGPSHHLHIALVEGRFRGEGIRKRKNGDEFLADVYIRSIHKDNVHLGYAIIISDLSERNKLLQASNLSKAEIFDLKSEKAVREQFVTHLSHDLKSPLTVARASAEFLARHLEPTDRNYKFLEKILSSLDRTNTMINKLLDANKLKAGKGIHLMVNDWDLTKLVQSVCEDFQTTGNAIQKHLPDHEICGRWDGEGIRRVLENLIGNAIKYGDPSYPVDVTVIETDEEVSLMVHNMGEVIRPADKNALFEQFTRTESAIKTQKGWGIGLNLVKEVTEAHGGSIEVESLPAEGTTFIVNLPRYCA